MEVNIFKNQYGYSTIARNGEDKMYIQVQFKKDLEPSFEKGKIKIHDGFFSMYKNKNGYAMPKVVVMNYEQVKNEEEKIEETEEIQELDLPF